MGKQKSGFTVQVPGIQYREFAKLKWQQFLRIYSLVLMAVIAVIAVMGVMGRLPQELPLMGALAIVLIVLAVLAVYRGGIKQEYRRSGLSGLALEYAFDRDGWTVRSGEGQVTVPWTKTFRVKKNDQALLLYPNRKSVNLVPLRNLSQQQVEKIIAWCTGNKA